MIDQDGLQSSTVDELIEILERIRLINSQHGYDEIPPQVYIDNKVKYDPLSYNPSPTTEQPRDNLLTDDMSALIAYTTSFVSLLIRDRLDENGYVYDEDETLQTVIENVRDELNDVIEVVLKDVKETIFSSVVGKAYSS